MRTRMPESSTSPFHSGHISSWPSRLRVTDRKGSAFGRRISSPKRSRRFLRRVVGLFTTTVGTDGGAP